MYGIAMLNTRFTKLLYTRVARTTTIGKQEAYLEYILRQIMVIYHFPFAHTEQEYLGMNVRLPGMVRCGEQATLFQWLPCLCDCEICGPLPPSIVPTIVPSNIGDSDPS
jgi:hypothetical protein